MAEPDDTAVALARLRAAGTAAVPAEQRSAMNRRAGRLGRRLVDVGAGRAVLAWDDGVVPEADDTWSTHRLQPVAVRTLAACLALCWPEPAEAPYPGRVTTVAEVVAALTAQGVDTRHGRGSLRGELAVAGLIVVDGDEVRLGPAVASWSPAQVVALRRLHGRLPRPPSPPPAGEATEPTAATATDGEDGP